ncbi:MAG: EamA family transporter [Candidatus Omnitrophota bacterium]|nr:EamA family transporter [Candidatus Omnitrophota bacterium]
MKQHILFIIGLIALTDFFDTVSQLILKSSINSLDWQINSLKKAFRLIWQLLKTSRIWFSFLLSLISLSIWLFVLSKTELNLAFSLDSMRYIMIAFASVIFLKEKVGITRWLGIICVAAGIFLVTMG